MVQKKVGLSESALRERADREGHQLVKSRDTGLYGLRNVATGGMDFGWDYDASLDDVFNYLSEGA